jgi:hypothetical protein
MRFVHNLFGIAARIAICEHQTCEKLTGIEQMLTSVWIISVLAQRDIYRIHKFTQDSVHIRVMKDSAIYARLDRMKHSVNTMFEYWLKYSHRMNPTIRVVIPL